MGYRLIIADDEPKIIQLIRQLGHFGELGIEIIDECHTGQEAYESIVRNRPDFVLSDIKMPVYDGIELIRMVRDAKLDPLFVLLSGYRHFEYARSAISLNVMDYLLKPIDEDQLNETLKKVCIRIDQQRLQREDRESLSQFRANRNRQDMERFWNQLIGPGQSEEELCFASEELCNRTFHTEFEEGCYQAVYIFSNLGAILGSGDTISSSRVDSFIDASFRDLAKVCCYNTYKGYVLILNFPEGKRSEIRQAVAALYYKIRDLRETYGEIRVSIGCSRIKYSVRELKTACMEAHSAQWGRLVLAANGVLDFDQVAGLRRFSRKELISGEEYAQICDCIKYLRTEELGDVFEKIYQRAGGFNNANPQDMLQTFFYLQAAVLASFEEDEKKKRIDEDSHYAYFNGRSFQQVIRNLFLVCQKYLDEEKAQLKEKMGKPIRMAARFIQEHYGEQISLEDAAAAGNVSPTYLSKLFRNEMGVGFNDFLTQVRLEESEKLLAQTALPIREIAARVGYLDEKYYSKLFKKATGIKPTDYRKIYS